MLKAFLLATALLTVSSFAHAAGATGQPKINPSSSSGASSYSSHRYQLYKRRAEMRNASLQAKADKINKDSAAIKAGQQEAKAKYDAAMNAATRDLSNGVLVGTCVTCR